MKSYWMRTLSALAAGAALLLVSQARAQEAASQEEQKGPPLPFHTIEGVGGGSITPMAYLVNPGSDDQIFGKPAAAVSSVFAGQKSLTAITVTDTALKTFEFGFAAERLGFGSLTSDILSATGQDIGADEWLFNFNVRTLLLKENYNDNNNSCRPSRRASTRSTTTASRRSTIRSAMYSQGSATGTTPASISP